MELREAQGEVEVQGLVKKEKKERHTSGFQSQERGKTSSITMGTQREEIRSGVWKRETKDEGVQMSGTVTATTVVVSKRAAFVAFEARRRRAVTSPKNHWWLKVKRVVFCFFFNSSDSASSPQRVEVACPVPRQPSRPKRYQKWPPAERLFDKTVSAVFGKQWGMFASSL